MAEEQSVCAGVLARVLAGRLARFLCYSSGGTLREPAGEDADATCQWPMSSRLGRIDSALGRGWSSWSKGSASCELRGGSP